EIGRHRRPILLATVRRGRFSRLGRLNRLADPPTDRVPPSGLGRDHTPDSLGADFPTIFGRYDHLIDAKAIMNLAFGMNPAGTPAFTVVKTRYNNLEMRKGATPWTARPMQPPTRSPTRRPTPPAKACLPI